MRLVDRGIKWTAAAEAIITPTTRRLLTPHSLLAWHDHDHDRDRGGGQGHGYRNLKHVIQSVQTLLSPGGSGDPYRQTQAGRCRQTTCYYFGCFIYESPTGHLTSGTDNFFNFSIHHISYKLSLTNLQNEFRHEVIVKILEF